MDLLVDTLSIHESSPPSHIRHVTHTDTTTHAHEASGETDTHSDKQQTDEMTQHSAEDDNMHIDATEHTEEQHVPAQEDASTHTQQRHVQEHDAIREHAMHQIMSSGAFATFVQRDVIQPSHDDVTSTSTSTSTWTPVLTQDTLVHDASPHELDSEQQQQHHDDAQPAHEHVDDADHAIHSTTAAHDRHIPALRISSVHASTHTDTTAPSHPATMPVTNTTDAVIVSSCVTDASSSIPPHVSMSSPRLSAPPTPI